MTSQWQVKVDHPDRPALRQGQGFEVIPRRRVVERTFATLLRNRWLAEDFERTGENAKAWLFIASVQMLARRIATRCDQ